ncbi:hypothetical protein ACMGE6_10750 [Macrococcus equi]|uniref:hypothetical protein n=1 Tax=Macrococcus equi TaxID=3395462 RepID=UPI0039BE7A17
MIDIDTEIDVKNGYNYVGNIPISTYDTDGNYRRLARVIWNAAAKKQTKDQLKNILEKNILIRKKAKEKRKNTMETVRKI